MPTLKGKKGPTRTKTDQYAESNLSVKKLQIKAAIERKRGYTWSSCYYCLINGKRIGEAILSEMDNMIIIIADHIKYLEAQKLRNTKEASYRSATWSKPANTNLWGILSVLLVLLLQLHFDSNPP